MSRKYGAAKLGSRWTKVAKQIIPRPSVCSSYRSRTWWHQGHLSVVRAAVAATVATFVELPERDTVCCEETALLEAAGMVEAAKTLVPALRLKVELFFGPARFLPAVSAREVGSCRFSGDSVVDGALSKGRSEWPDCWCTASEDEDKLCSDSEGLLRWVSDSGSASCDNLVFPVFVWVSSVRILW